MAVKASNVIARVEPDLKEKAEDILGKLGISASGAINMLYRQIVYTNGLPFSLTLPKQPNSVEEMTREQFDQMIETGLAQAKAGQGVDLDLAFQQLHGSIRS